MAPRRVKRGALTRRHALATLTRAWGKALRGAIRHADVDGLIVDPNEPALVAATPAQAYALAGDLAALIDDMIIEGAPWTRLPGGQDPQGELRGGAQSIRLLVPPTGFEPALPP